MARFLVFIALLGSVAAQCSVAAYAALQNPDFGWIIADPASQKGNLTQICNPQNPTHLNNFNAAITQLQTQCAPATNGTTSPMGLIFEILQGVLCLQINGQLCGLSLFALFDLGYFLCLQSAASGSGVPPVPDLTSILQDPNRKAAICASDTCNEAIEQYASSFYRPAIDNSDSAGLASTQLAIDFCTRLANRMRCGCFTSGATTCYTTATLGSYVNNGTLVPATACAADGSVTPCARLFMTCDELPAPKCTATPPCTGWSATIQFQIKNLNTACFNAALVGSAAQTIAADLKTNLLGTLATDFTLDCTSAGNGNNNNPWVTCTATIKCVTQALINENNVLPKILDYSQWLVISSKTLDELVPLNCKIDASHKTYGETTTFTVTVTAGAAQLSASFAVFIALLALF